MRDVLGGSYFHDVFARGHVVTTAVGSARTHKVKRKRLRQQLRAAGLSAERIATISARYERSQAARRASTT